MIRLEESFSHETENDYDILIMMRGDEGLWAKWLFFFFEIEKHFSSRSHVVIHVLFEI